MNRVKVQTLVGGEISDDQLNELYDQLDQQQLFYVFRTLSPISVPSAKTTCLTMRTFSKRKPNKKFIELEFFSSS